MFLGEEIGWISCKMNISRWFLCCIDHQESLFPLALAGMPIFTIPRCHYYPQSRPTARTRPPNPSDDYRRPWRHLSVEISPMWNGNWVTRIRTFFAECFCVFVTSGDFYFNRGRCKPFDTHDMLTNRGYPTLLCSFSTLKGSFFSVFLLHPSFESVL